MKVLRSIWVIFITTITLPLAVLLGLGVLVYAIYQHICDRLTWREFGEIVVRSCKDSCEATFKFINTGK